jgi:hypothetical protein
MEKINKDKEFVNSLKYNILYTINNSYISFYNVIVLLH